MDEMMSLRVLIADDEPLVRRDLLRLLSTCEGVDVIGEAHDGQEAVDRIEKLMPDVVFLDVQMPELDGFSVLAALQHAQPQVVFVTAYDAYAARAFDIHAVDYLLKPFDPPRLRAAVDRVRMRLSSSAADDALRPIEALGSRLAARGESLQRLAVRVRGRIRYIATDDVDWIESADNYVMVHSDGDRYVIRSTMRAIEEALDPAQFVRTHRSYIVHIARVLEVEQLFKGDGVVILHSGARLPLSRNYRDAFRRAMRGG